MQSVRNALMVLFSLFAVNIASANNQSKTISWDELVPAIGKGAFLSVTGSKPLVGQPDRKSFEGSDEDFAYLMESIKSMRYSQPQGASIRTDIDGSFVRIPGYISPISFDELDVTEFLLVPYHGACIHVPPPPGNQVIYVKNAKGISADELYDPVWVTGKISAKPVGTILADAGYQIDEPTIEPYEE